MSDFPFTEQKIAKNVFLREFKNSVDPEELVWHQDRENRTIKVIQSDGWMLQMDNKLPVFLEEGKLYRIPALQFHRVIKGAGNLKIKIIKEEYRLYLEGQANDLVKKHPELQPAWDAGIRKFDYLNWIFKRRGGEPIKDVIGVVKSFDEKKPRLKEKGSSSNIYDYKTPSILRQALEDLGESKGEERRRLRKEETTYLGTFGDWSVYMPHTRESSCQLGKGTTWCTVATQSQNLFYHYVARPESNIILYYVIGRGEFKKKLSIGFVDGKPELSGKFGDLDRDWET